MESAPGNNECRHRGMRRRTRNRAQAPAFGNWDYNDQQHHQQLHTTQYFDYCSTKPEPVLLDYSYASTLHPYAHSYSPAYTAYVNEHHFPYDHDAYNHHYDAVLQQHHFDNFNTKTTCVVAAEVKGVQSRPQRRRRSYLGVDNNSKVFDITETIHTPTHAPGNTDKCYGQHKDDVVVVTADLYDVGSANIVTARKDEDLYKIPPEQLRKSKRTKKKKMRKFFTKCFVTICASY